MDQTGKRIINQDFFDKSNHRNKHVAIFGASSSGKTFSYVKPFCIQAVRRRESLVITDPKGELYEDTVQYFKGSGYIVRRFDLKNLALSDGWDILSEIRGDPDRADILAKIIWGNISNGSSSGSIFESGPVSLLKAILLRVALDDGMKIENRQNIGEAYQMLQNPEGEEGLDKQFDSRTLDEKLQVCVGPYMSYKQGSPNMRGNILITLSSLLNVFQSETVRKITSQNDIDLSLPGKMPCVYYCILPDMHSTYNFIGAVFFSFLFLDLVDYADNQPDRRCKVPVNFLFDEFANIGTIPEFDKKLATIRSRALNVSIILQDLPQLMGRYPETYQSILSNCATYVNIGCNDEATAEFFSNRAGEATIQVRTDQHETREPALKIGNKHSTGEGKRKIFTPDELMTFSMDECLIVWQALYTMRAFKYPFVDHPEAKRMKKTSILNYPPISDTAAREKLREEEKARVAAYEEKLKEGYNPFAYFGGVLSNVSDEVIAEEQKIFWFEVGYEKIMEGVHSLKCVWRKLSRKLDKALSDSPGDEIIDAEAWEVEEAEAFTIKTTAVENWVFAEATTTEEAWSLADEPDPEKQDAPMEDQLIETTTMEEPPVEKPLENFAALDAMEPEDDEDEMEGINDFTGASLFGISAEETEEDDDEIIPSDQETEIVETPVDIIEDSEPKSEITTGDKEEITPQATTENTETLLKPDVSAQPKKKKKDKNEEFKFNWDLLGSQLDFRLRKMKVTDPSGSPDIDRVIQEQIKKLNQSLESDIFTEQSDDILSVLQADMKRSQNAASRKAEYKKKR